MKDFNSIDTKIIDDLLCSRYNLDFLFKNKIPLTFFSQLIGLHHFDNDNCIEYLKNMYSKNEDEKEILEKASNYILKKYLEAEKNIDEKFLKEMARIYIE